MVCSDSQLETKVVLQQENWGYSSGTLAGAELRNPHLFVVSQKMMRITIIMK